MTAAPMEVRTVEDGDLWDRFVAESPQGTVFSTIGWMRIAAHAQGGDPVVLGLFEEQKLLAGAAFLHVRRGPFRKATTPALTPYGGMLWRPFRGKRRSEEESFQHTAAEPLIRHLNERYHRVVFVHPPAVADVRPFTWAGYAARVRYTYLLDIADPARIWDQMEHRVRTVIRNAKDTLSVDSALGTDRFAILYEHVFRDRGNEPPVPVRVVERMADEVLAAHMGDLRVVRDSDGKAVCAGVFVRDGRAVYAWVSGALPSRNQAGAMSLLFWDTAARYGADPGMLDMVGGNIPGVAFFKKGFGGTLAPYYVTERTGGGFAGAVFSLHTALRGAGR